MTDPTALTLLRDVEAYLSALHVHVARHDNIGADFTCGGCLLRDRIAAALPQLAAVPVPAADQTTDRAAVLSEAAGRYEEILAKADTASDPRYWTAVRDITLGLRHMAAEAQPTTRAEPDEDPARIDRLRPEFTEHSSVEAIDAQLRRSRAQERRWHIRTEWLISLRADRVAQKARGEWPAAGARQDGAQQS